jgi:menaquinone-dependent protoporphyrinogen oxidase
MAHHRCETFSLASAFPDAHYQAVEYCERFVSDTGWKPDKVAYVAGAVQHEDYGYFREQILEHLVLEGAHYDDLVDDHEFTDWQAVGEAVQSFLAN